jgi:hypothetical protein
MTKFRPSNGTEGLMFMERNCFLCIKDDEEKGIFCPLIAASMAFDKEDPRYPEEWQGEFADPRTWVCTAKEEDNDTIRPVFNRKESGVPGMGEGA